MLTKGVYRVFGMRRSGNHVFINWLLNQLEGDNHFYNNVNMNDLKLQESDSRSGNEKDVENLIFSFEDRNLNVAAKRQWLRNIGVENTVLTTDFIILRDPLNLFASRIRSKKIEPLFFSGMNVPELTYQHFYFCDYLTEWRNSFGGNLVPIIFDRFVAEEEYRKSISRQAGFPYKDISIDNVDVRYGGGSSFDQGNTARPSSTDLKNRWFKMTSDPLWRQWAIEFSRLTQPYLPHYCTFASQTLTQQGIELPVVKQSWLERQYRAVIVGVASVLRLSQSLGKLRATLRHRG